MADKILTELVINRGTKQKFDNLPTKSPDELYFITDTETFQRKLIAGQNITIDEATNTISATGGSDEKPGYNIGDIFYTKRKDSGLGGAVECNGGTYSTADYEGEGSIGELLEGGLLDYISLTDYATAISTKGWCDKIGWDGGTTVRVPTLTPHIIQKNNIPVAGNGMVLGLKNATQNLGLNMIVGGALTAYVGDYGANIGAHSGSPSNSVGTYGITTDGAKSGIIADTTDTAQLRVMFQLFNATTDEAVATVGTVVAQVGELNSHRVVDFQIPTAENGYTWYRKYADGWVEQGGIKEAGPTIITFPVVMVNTDYWYIAKGNYNNQSGSYASSHDCVITKNTTNMVLSTGGTSVCWQVSGISA